MKAFIYKGELYLRCIPGKMLFRSTMVHDVVNRGDIFAMNVNTQEFTVISGKSEVTHLEASLSPIQKPLDLEAEPRYTAPSRSQKKKLQAVRSDLAAPKFLVGDLVRLAWWTNHAVPIVQATETAAGWTYKLQGMIRQYDETQLRKFA